MCHVSSSVIMSVKVPAHLFLPTIVLCVCPCLPASCLFSVLASLWLASFTITCQSVCLSAAHHTSSVSLSVYLSVWSHTCLFSIRAPSSPNPVASRSQKPYQCLTLRYVPEFLRRALRFLSGINQPSISSASSCLQPINPWAVFSRSFLFLESGCCLVHVYLINCNSFHRNTSSSA